ncbi:hypothetical protein SAMN04489806_1972 [Paramicrobacterium humi]|uniref:DUF4153 domain-containing protein n=1 Tax=Paramicrobacterium humi TaxID=640635 RepID=A0A1H4MT13_9MICO|nr:permease prefix domain 1-containing protein [Microbacterium humi]SEB86129.1 hypothetical protein SAMN04489806_1972 [Microbacterium humi]
MAATDQELETQIAQWRDFIGRRREIGADVDELEAHLRDRIEALAASGLSNDEAFLVAVKRLGRIDELSREFAREHSERLWKQLVIGDTGKTGRRDSGLTVALVFAVIAGAIIKLPALFGLSLETSADVYLRNAALLLLPMLAGYFLVRRRAHATTIIGVVVPFIAAGALLNAYPFAADGMTELLAAVHAVVALWIVAGIAYANGDWRSGAARMDLIRFTGEWVVYFVLLALGGGVLAALTIGVFLAVGVDAFPFVTEWMLPCGAAGAVVVAAWLVEAKQSVIENIAPVLTRVFTPLFTMMLLVLIGTAVVQRTVVDADRDLLIIFDLVLIVTLGLLLYSLSARNPDAPASWFETMQLVLVIAALVVDVFVLAAMLGRIGTYGASANKLASLGLNLILLVNLAGAAWLQLRFLRGKERFTALERWQTAYVPVYLAWAAIVVIVFPPVFAFA